MANVSIEVLEQTREYIECIYKELTETSHNLMFQYKMQESSWDDLKYRELGKEILRCNKELVQNINIIKNALITLDAFIKKVKEYEVVEVDFLAPTGSDDSVSYSSSQSHVSASYATSSTGKDETLGQSSFLSSLQGMTNTEQDSTFSNPELKRCGNVEINNNALEVSYKYREMIDRRIENATERARKVYNTYSKRVRIQNPLYDGRAGYYDNDTFEKGIYYDYRQDPSGIMFFHFFATMLDAFQNHSYSHHPSFVQNVQRECAAYRGNHPILVAMTRATNQLSEKVFATFFQASMGNPTLLNEIKTHFHNSYQIYNEMLDDMVGYERGDLMR